MDFSEYSLCTSMIYKKEIKIQVAEISGQMRPPTGESSSSLLETKALLPRARITSKSKAGPKQYE